MIIKVAVIINNSDKFCNSYDNLRLGITFFGTQGRSCPQISFVSALCSCILVFGDG